MAAWTDRMGGMDRQDGLTWLRKIREQVETSRDSEAIHIDADGALLLIVEGVCPEAAAIYRDLQDQIDFWYA